MRLDSTLVHELQLFAKQLDRVGLIVQPIDVAKHVQLGNPKLPTVQADTEFLCWADDWLACLTRANASRALVDVQALNFASAFF